MDSCMCQAVHHTATASLWRRQQPALCSTGMPPVTWEVSSGGPAWQHWNAPCFTFCCRDVPLSLHDEPNLTTATSCNVAGQVQNKPMS